MILTIAAVAAAVYLAIFFFMFAFSFIMTIYTGDWKEFVKTLGVFFLFNSWIVLGLSIGTFIFGNILNFMMQGEFVAQVFNPNVVGTILFMVYVAFQIFGKMLMGKGRKIYNI